MAIELLAKYCWELQNYLVKTRVNYKGEKGGIRDIDVLAHHPIIKDCIIAGCKAWAVLKITRYGMFQPPQN